MKNMKRKQSRNAKMTNNNNNDDDRGLTVPGRHDRTVIGDVATPHVRREVRIRHRANDGTRHIAAVATSIASAQAHHIGSVGYSSRPSGQAGGGERDIVNDAIAL